MKEKVIIYLHGYNGSPESPKVKRLREVFEPDVHVLSWKIDADAKIAEQDLNGRVVDILMDRMHNDIQLYFVGTSLGGWLAAVASESWGFPCVLINPSMEPNVSLKRYPELIEVANSYFPISPPIKSKTFLGEKDELFDFADYIRQWSATRDITVVPGANHQFNDDFELVVAYLRTKLGL